MATDKKPESIKLTKDEYNKLKKLNGKIAEVQFSLMGAFFERLVFIRQICHDRGIISLDLKNLSSKNGRPFIEIIKGLPFRRAQAGHACRQAGCGPDKEEAYLCAKTKFGDWRMECGWVKGRPMKFEAEEGKSGVIYRCRICNRIIGEEVP